MALAQYSLNWASNLCGTATNFFHSTRLPHLPPRTTVIEDVKIWDGDKYLDDTSITIEGQTISFVGATKKPRGARTVSGHGGFLMPGLIDAHVHISTGLFPALVEHLDREHMKTMVRSGITTAFDMGSWPSSKMRRWSDKGKEGLTSLLFSGPAATTKDGFPGIMPDFPSDSVVTSKETAKDYTLTRIKEGADYIKIVITGKQTPELEYQQIIKNLSDQHGKFLVSHAPDYKAQEMARKVGGKFITHVPKDRELDEAGVQEMLDNDQVAIPTLIMSQNLIQMGYMFGQTDNNYTYSNDSVALMHKMKVPILVGTDCSKPIGFVEYGKSLHTELGLLHDAGMCPEDILRSATSLPAKYFNLTDRGRIAVGMRADLLLLKKNPIDNITNSDTIDEVWTAGTSAFKKLL